MTKARPTTGRQRRPKGTGSILQNADGSWQGFVSLGKDENGKRIRRSVQRKTREEVAAAMIAMQAAHLDAPPPATHGPGTCADWFQYWLDEVVTGYAKPSTYANYEGVLRRTIIPGLGSINIGRLTERHIEGLLDTIPTRSGQELALKTLRASLEVARRRRVVKENVAELVKIRRHKPVSGHVDQEWDADLFDDLTESGRRQSIPTEHMRAILVEVHKDRLRARWMLGFLGARRAEVLGLVWPDLSADGVLTFRRNRVRASYRHGCPNEILCNRSPGRCPMRARVPEVVSLKTASSWRRLPLGPGMVKVLQEHRERQDQDREFSASASAPTHPWMFTTPEGVPLSHDADYRLWKQLLKRAGVPITYKPHELRHTAASLLGAKDVNEATLMGLMGWSTTRMVDNYRHPELGLLKKALEELEKDYL